MQPHEESDQMSSALHRIEVVAAAFAVAAIAVPVTQAGLERRDGLHNSKPSFVPLTGSTMLGSGYGRTSRIGSSRRPWIKVIPYRHVVVPVTEPGPWVVPITMSTMLGSGYGLVGPRTPRTGSTDELSASNEFARHHVVPIRSPRKEAAAPLQASWGLARALAGERFVPTRFLVPRVALPKSSALPRCLGGIAHTWFVPVRCLVRPHGRGPVYLAAAVADPSANAVASYADALAAAGSYGNIPTLQYRAAIAARPTLKIPTSYRQAVTAAGIYGNVPTEQYRAAIAATGS
jgi:hypothetical protein